MAVNAATLNLIKEFEGFEGKAYYDPVGVLTIGYGHTNLSGQPPKVVPGLTISEPEASKLLVRLLDKVYEPAVKKNVKVPLTENQYGALVSWTYNLGEGNLKKSTMLKRLNAGDYEGAADEMLKWNRAGGKVLRGLTRRRKAERALFLTPQGNERKPPVTVDTPPLTLWDLIKKLFGL